MDTLTTTEINSYVNENIVDFHQRRLAAIKELSLTKLIKKNPYLFKAKNINKASDLIESTMDAFLSSSEEKMFGDFLEGLAIFVSSKTCGGSKSSCQGIDLEFKKDETYYLVTIKSGENWGNSSQHKKMIEDMGDATKRLKQSQHVRNVQCVLGICYGKSKTTFHEKNYLRIVGQNFWAFISNIASLYLDIIEPIGFRAREHNDQYEKERSAISNILTKNFIEIYCDPTGKIKWDLVVKANSENYDLDDVLR